jgi:hypothetical protein
MIPTRKRKSPARSQIHGSALGLCAGWTLRSLWTPLALGPVDLAGPFSSEDSLQPALSQYSICCTGCPTSPVSRRPVYPAREVALRPPCGGASFSGCPFVVRESVGIWRRNLREIDTAAPANTVKLRHGDVLTFSPGREPSEVESLSCRVAYHLRGALPRGEQ